MSLYCLNSGLSRVVASKEQIASEVGGEMVILNLKSGIYYGLNPIGTRMWQLLQTPTTVDAIRDAILEEYDVEPATCDRDIKTLLQELSNQGLIEVVDGQVA